MQERVPLSIRDQALLTLGCALVFSIAITAAGYMGAAQTRDEIAAFASDGAVADGVVTEKRVDMVMASKATVWWLEIAFKTERGEDRKSRMVVANSIYDRYQPGSPIRVTYVRSKPEWFYVPDAEPTIRDEGISEAMFKYGAVAGAGSLAGLLGLLFAGRGGGAPKAKPPAIVRSSGAASYGGPSAPRAEFGTRRRS